MKTLDCETDDSAAESLCSILEVCPNKLQSIIADLLGGDFEIDTNQVDDRWLPMLRQATGKEMPEELPGKTFWFHATRASDFHSFKHGLRDVRSQLDETWSYLHTLVADTVDAHEWARFRKQVENDSYGHGEETHAAWMSDGGPCAFLFAETPLNPGETNCHDYLGISELVDSIAACFDREYRVDLRELHRQATKPYLVKFVSPGIRKVHLGAALDYLVYKKCGWPLVNVTPCFSSEGVSIPARRINKVIPCETGQRRLRGTIYAPIHPSRHIHFHEP